MTKITGLSSNPDQIFTINSPNGDGTTIDFELIYHPRTQEWIANITYGNFAANGIHLVRGPNILHKFKRTWKWGLCVTCTDSYEPFLINDFSTERVVLYLLTTDEIETVDTMIQEGYSV